jgi:hypothetical protein
MGFFRKGSREKMQRIVGGLSSSRYIAKVGFSDIAEELADKLREDFRKLSRKLNDGDLSIMVGLYPELIQVLSDKDRRRVHEVEVEPEAEIDQEWIGGQVAAFLASLMGLEYEQCKEMMAEPPTEKERKLRRISGGLGLVDSLANSGDKDMATKLFNKLQGELRELAPDLSDDELKAMVASEPKLLRGLSKSDQMRVLKRNDYYA